MVGSRLKKWACIRNDGSRLECAFEQWACVQNDEVVFGTMGSRLKQWACVRDDKVAFGVMGSRSKQLRSE